MTLPAQEAHTHPRSYPSIGVQIPQVYLPRPDINMEQWSVIACDQYTSQPEYWQQVKNIVGQAPSTLNLIFPEIYLDTPHADELTSQVQENMQHYLDEGLLMPQEGLIYIERTAGEKLRKGLILCLDLEQYDYHAGSQSLIRATEGTIEERLPPRMKIRQGAALELPHILVLIDDPQQTVIEPLAHQTERMQILYDYDLMLDSGHLRGFRIEDRDLEAQVINALEKLVDPRLFSNNYGVGADESPLLFAMGDGNHSLATAKAVWEKIKPQVGLHHPARYALVEIENVHDQGLQFEPIHRVLFNLKTDIFVALQDYFGDGYRYSPSQDCLEMEARVKNPLDGRQSIGLVINHQFGVLELDQPSSNLAVGTLQPFLDQLIQAGQAEKIDYVHGKCVICKLSAQDHNVGFYLPPMDKSELFKTVILDGALPRKTFSMGEAFEKRFYVECRKIV